MPKLQKKTTAKKEKKAVKPEKKEKKSTRSAAGSVAVDKKVMKEAEKLMKQLIEMLDVDAEVTVSAGSYENAEGKTEEFVDVKIDGEEIGVLIGYLGRNLRSLQRIVSMLLNRRLGIEAGGESYVRVVVDVSGYREKRESSLERMAEQVREEALAGNESVDLPPMSAYERRVIHTHLGTFEDVTTESFGEGRDRYVRVFPVTKDK